MKAQDSGAPAGPPLARGRLRRLLIAAVAVIALGLSVPACGGDSGSEETASQGSGEESPRPRSQGGAGFDPRGIYDDAAPGVVTVTSIFAAEDLSGLFGGGQDGGGQEDGEEGDGGGGGRAAGQGSGFVISDEGEIVTNAHVVTDAQRSGPNDDLHEARQVFVQFPDRNSVPAEVIGVDPFADVALLEVDPEGLDLEPLEFGSSDEVEVGADVAAIGSPFGQVQSLSIGIVSAIDRSIESLTEFQIDGAIQTDASINPGNSGGPLLNAAGRVVGVNQQINTRSGGNEGVGFAVPSDLVTRSIEALREDGEPDYAYIGVSAQPLYPQLAERLDIPSETGTLIAEVVPGSPADEAGLEGGDERIRFQGQPIRIGGDVITAVDGEKLLDESDLPQLISKHGPGDEITLEVLHADGERDEVTVELEARPSTIPDNG